ncbi:MAG: LysR substrate-binding domain-containing protein [Caulobacterales bacterium]
MLEACARHLSFSRAAEELGVSPAAVTQQIRQIESWAGAPLFRRTGRQVLATSTLSSAIADLKEGFDKLSAASQALRSPSRRNRVVSISAPPSFASKWLLARIDGFRALYPDTDLWVSADMNLVDFSSSDIDVAIRYGAGAYEGLIAERLMSESVRPVASPSLVSRLGPFRSVEDILRAPLLHDANVENDPSCPTWPMWLKARGVQGASPRGLRFSQSSMVIEQAIAGNGIALAKDALSAGDMNDGKLVPLFNDSTPLAFAYWLVWPRGRTLSPQVRNFVSWLKAETTPSAVLV